MAKLPLAIIGSGFSAASILYQLSKAGLLSAPVLVIGAGHLGAGQAYGTDNPYYRLNVRAELQGLFPEPEDDFAKWARLHLDDDLAIEDEGIFYKRSDFRAYVDSCLAAETIHEMVRQVPHEAVALEPLDKGWRIHLETNESYEATAVIVAVGNAISSWPMPVDKMPPSATKRLIHNCWVGDFYDEMLAEKPQAISIVGGGLTAFDAVNSLYHMGYQGQIQIITPLGIMPPKQAAWQKGRSAKDWPAELNAQSFLSHIRAQLPKHADWTSAEWQACFEAVRLILPQGWQALHDRDKRRIIKRCGGYWSLARYRAGPQAVNAAQVLSESGQLQIFKDRIMHISPHGSAFRLRGQSGTAYHCDFVLNATGGSRHKLITDFVAKGYARADALSLTMKTSTKNNVIKPDGTPWDNLWMVGPPTAGTAGDVVGAVSTARQIAHMIAQNELASR